MQTNRPLKIKQKARFCSIVDQTSGVFLGHPVKDASLALTDTSDNINQCHRNLNQLREVSVRNTHKLI